MTISERGKPLLVISGYNYKFNRFIKTKDEYHWRCNRSDCRASVYTKKENGSDTSENNVRVVRFSWDHSHEPAADNVISRKIITQSAKRKAANDLMEKPSKILHLEIEKFPEVVNSLKDKDVNCLRKILYNARRKVMPIIPKNRQEALQQLKCNISTIRGEIFLEYVDEESGNVVFSCATNLGN